MPKVEKILVGCKTCHTLFTVCPAAFLATKLSGMPTSADIFCSAADRRLNCDMGTKNLLVCNLAVSAEL